MPYLYYAITAALFFGISILITKFSSKHTIDNPSSLLFYYLLGSIIFIIPFSFFVTPVIPSLSILLTLLVSASGFIIGYWLFCKGVFTTDASTLAPLFQVQTLLIAILAYFFLNERFATSNYSWSLLLILGTVLVTLDESMKLKSFLKKGTLFILLMQVFHATSNLFAGFALNKIDYLQLSFWNSIYIILALIPTYFILKPKTSIPIKKTLPVMLANVISSTGAVFLYRAFQTNLTISSVIAMLSSPFVFIFTVIASTVAPSLLEHHSKKVYMVRGLGLMLTLFSAY